MSQEKDRQLELLSIALGARRRDMKPSREAPPATTIEPGVPTPHDDLMSDFYRSLSDEQRELLRKALEAT